MSGPATPDFPAPEFPAAGAQPGNGAVARLLDSIGDAVLVLDRAFRIRHANAAAVRIDGRRTRRELLGLHLLEAWPEAASMPTWPAYQRALASQEKVELTYHHLSAAHDVWLEVSAFPSPEGLTIVYRDVSARVRAEAALRDSEAKLSAVLDALPVGVIIADAKGRLVRDNAAHRALWGLPPETAGWEEYGAWIGFRPGGERLRAEDWAMARALQHGEVTRGELVECQPFGGGERRFFLNNAAPMRDESGRIVGAVAAEQDVTALHRAKRARAETEGLLRSLGEASPDLIYAKDRQGRMRYANPTALAVIGRPAEAVLGRTDAEWLSDPSQAAPLLAADQRVMARGVPETLEETVTDARSGQVRVWQSVKAPLRDPATGTVTGLVGISRDITEARAARDTLAESQARLQNLLATLDLGSIMVRDMDGTLRFWSEGCARLYGWSAEEAVGRSVHELLATVFPEPRPAIEATLLRDGVWSGDLRHRRRDGAEIIVAARKVLRRDAAGRPAEVMESVADVSALRRAEAELRRLNEDLEARVLAEVAALEAAQARLAQSEKLAALGQLAGGIAHDFNNVVQAVSGGAGLIRRRAADPLSVERLAQMLEDAARRGASITRRLLAFARRGELRAEKVDMSALLDGLREVLEHTLGGGITVRVDAAPGLPPVLADRGQLEAALVNLATNARDAMPGGGTLTLSAAPEQVLNGEHPERLTRGHYIRIGVADTGTGMDVATLARVMEPFFTTKPQGEGTGLGLPMVRGFAEQSGGALSLQSAPGQGTVVTLWLPVAPEGEGSPDLLVEKPPSGDDGVPRLLLVDDEDLVREVLAAQLADAGYEVIQAEGSATALALLDAGERVDLLIADLAMPGLDGVALIREAHRRRPRLPAILLTGYAGDAAALAVGGAIAGAFSLLRKPVGGALLAERVATLLEAVQRI